MTPRPRGSRTHTHTHTHTHAYIRIEVILRNQANQINFDITYITEVHNYYIFVHVL